MTNISSPISILEFGSTSIKFGIYDNLVLNQSLFYEEKIEFRKNDTLLEKNLLKTIIKKAENQIEFDFYGFGEKQPVWGKEFLDKIANSKMGLNLSRGYPIKYYSSDRITQIAGNGLVTLIDEKTGYRDFFSDKEMVFYSNINDLSEKISKISKDDKLRRLIAKKGKDKYTKYFNSNLVADFIVNKTFDINNKKKYLWHDK